MTLFAIADLIRQKNLSRVSFMSEIHVSPRIFGRYRRVLFSIRQSKSAFVLTPDKRGEMGGERREREREVVTAFRLSDAPICGLRGIFVAVSSPIITA